MIRSTLRLNGKGNKIAVINKVEYRNRVRFASDQLLLFAGRIGSRIDDRSRHAKAILRGAQRVAVSFSRL